MLETVAIIGPARFGVPLTQALTAPILGRLHARGVGFWPQLVACALRPPAPQRRHHGLLHLGDRRRPRRLRRHLRRDRPADRHRGGHRRRGGAHGGEPARLGCSSPARSRCWSTGAGCAPGTTATEGVPERRWSGIGAENARFPTTVGDSTPGRSPSVLPLHSRCCSVARSGRSLRPWPPGSRRVARDPRRLRAAPSRRRLRRHPRRRARSCSPSAAGSGSTPRCGARCAPRCSCSPPPGFARRRAPRASARCRGARSGAASGECRRRPRPSSVLDRHRLGGRLAAAARGADRPPRTRRPSARASSSTRCSPGWSRSRKPFKPAAAAAGPIPQCRGPRLRPDRIGLRRRSWR